jgi:hypothetical protein
LALLIRTLCGNRARPIATRGRDVCRWPPPGQVRFNGVLLPRQPVAGGAGVSRRTVQPSKSPCRPRPSRPANRARWQPRLCAERAGAPSSLRLKTRSVATHDAALASRARVGPYAAEDTEKWGDQVLQPEGGLNRGVCFGGCAVTRRRFPVGVSPTRQTLLNCCRIDARQRTTPSVPKSVL